MKTASRAQNHLEITSSGNSTASLSPTAAQYRRPPLHQKLNPQPHRGALADKFEIPTTDAAPLRRRLTHIEPLRIRGHCFLRHVSPRHLRAPRPRRAQLRHNQSTTSAHSWDAAAASGSGVSVCCCVCAGPGDARLRTAVPRHVDAWLKAFKTSRHHLGFCEPEDQVGSERGAVIHLGLLLLSTH
ncbi:hypothetical protein AcV7_009098 [Taiwanofungus camphoratus]|nr:hypothetical protein AcV7_009098 [Antrodia cinnamomea]